MTYINIAIIGTLVLFNLIMLKFVWIILKSEKVNQLEAAVTSFVLIACAVIMTYTSVITVVYADDTRMETQYINGKLDRIPDKTDKHIITRSKYTQGRLHTTSKHRSPKLIHNPFKR